MIWIEAFIFELILHKTTMNKMIKNVVLFLFIAFSTVNVASAQRVAIVDIARLLENMPEYTTAQKQLDKLPDNVAIPIIGAIKNLSTNPRPSGCKKLKGRNGYRIRKGDYRIIYDIFNKELLVDFIALGHRREIYE